MHVLSAIQKIPKYRKDIGCVAYAVTASDIYFSKPFSECRECKACIAGTPLM